MEPRQSGESALLPGMDVHETLRQTLQSSLKHSESPCTSCRPARVQIQGKPCLNIRVMSYPHLSVSAFTCAYGSPQEPEACIPWSWTYRYTLSQPMRVLGIELTESSLSTNSLDVFKTKGDLLKSYAPKFSIKIHVFKVPVFTIVLMWKST